MRGAIADLTAAVAMLLKDALPFGTDLTGGKARKRSNMSLKTGFQELSGPGSQ